MSLAKTALISAISAAAVAAVAAPAGAQQVLAAPGITIIIAPAQPQPMPDAFQVMNAQLAQMNAVMQQMDAQMSAQMNQMSQLAATPAAMENLPAGAAGISITTISDGAKSCTEQVIYPGSGGAQKMEVSETGNACAALRMGQPAGPLPAALPAAPLRPSAPAPTPAPIVADNAAKPRPVMLADRD